MTVWPARGEGRVLSKEELEEDDGEAEEKEEEEVGKEEGQAPVALLPARVPTVLRIFTFEIFIILLKQLGQAVCWFCQSNRIIRILNELRW